VTLVSIEGAAPPRRFDGIPFTEVRWEESNTAAGPWTPLDTQPIAPASDPALPPGWLPGGYNLTTVAAVLDAGWYRLVWRDALGTEAPSDAVARGLPGVLPPAPDDIRSRSLLLRSKYETGDSDLGLVVQDATSLVASITCRKMDSSLPADLVGTAFRAITLKAEQLSVTSAAALVEKTATGRRVRSISAGPWSESYFAPGELVVKDGVPQIDPDPRLHEALWALMDDDCRAAWLAIARGENVAAGAVTVFNYGRRRVLSDFGPDGW
jgi:hypothetical protein